MALLAGCELTEITLNPGNRTVIVQSVLNRDTAYQFAVLEYSFNGDTTGRTSARRVIPPGRPQFPITGARVTLTYSAPGSCAGRVDTLAEQAGTVTNGVLFPSGTYAGVPCRLAPGERARMQVVTPAGEVVTGETIMPGITARTIRSGGVTARFVGDTLPLLRERDTLRVDFTAVSGRGIQLDARTPENPDKLLLYLFNDSLGLGMPGNIVNPFDNDGTLIFHAGHFYQLTVALGDTNYFDYVRSISDPITGRGYINHLNNGYGVFGSVDVEQYIIRATALQTDPREGKYRITGTVAGQPLDLLLDFYFDRDPGFDGQDEPVSGFVTGVVPEPAVFPDGKSGTEFLSVDQSGSGLFGSGVGTTRTPDVFQFAFQFTRRIGTQASAFRRYGISGIRSGPLLNPFPVTLRVTGANGGTLRTATLAARQTSGPVSSVAPHR